MNSRTTSFSAPRPSHVRRSSVSSRLSFTVSSAVERGDGLPPGTDAPQQQQQQQIEEEIAEIKRYEDFTTIDWVQDAAREQLRRKVRRKRAAGLFDSGQAGWLDRIYEAYDAAQGWIVVTLIGAAIGLNAAFLNIVTEWLSDIKLGYCTTAFYLNESFCCWGEDNGCADWHRWTGIGPVNYVVYIIFATFFAFTSASLVKNFAPYAAGSGISEIKCIIAGFVMKGFLGLRTLIIKSVALPLAIGSGLSVGKEGPSVHYAVCTGNVISRLFDKYRRNASKTREILSACAAAGVAVAFGSPIGGVLFSLEEMSSHFPLKTMWRSYFCALVATAVLAAMNPFRTGQLVMFQVRYDRSWHFFETLFYIVIGIFGGLYGHFVIKWNLRAQAFRKKYLAPYAVLEATLLAAATAILCYPNVFLRIDMTESMEILFLECEGAEDYKHLCEPSHKWGNIFALLSAAALRTFLVIISYGSKVPAGIFVPSMAIGASFGRTVGIVVQALRDAYPHSVFFSACAPDVPCITPGTYAFLGAAAALSGIMHITVSVVVIMFELTGALTYILPTMIVVGVTKAVSSLFPRKGGIADRMIWFSGFPYLDNKEDHNFGVPVSKVMTADVVALPATGLTLAEVSSLLSSPKKYKGFPVIATDEDRILLGYVGRTELRYALDRIGKEGRPMNPRAKCSFSPISSQFAVVGGGRRSASSMSAPGAGDGGLPAVTPITPTVTMANPFDSATATIDFSRYVDATPVTVHPRLPLETVMELFRKIGPRVILIEHRGRLVGLVTVKDCLKYQLRAEAAQHARTDEGAAAELEGINEGEEQLWGWLRKIASWTAGKVEGWTGGRIHLGDLAGIEGMSFSRNRADGWNGDGEEDRGLIMEGTEDVGDEDDGGVEMDSGLRGHHGHGRGGVRRGG
ncbi:hypothetical protein MKZ38_005503 [Zalerion maritima]|uniref:Chloride channel protein n=1 Tax=Zalerion maritima TaxID=339359 RepID=A0AAD5WWL0_9PEZI|nr:hypothetical protein MKZ38_005503 [Zalerion maritima]